MYIWVQIPRTRSVTLSSTWMCRRWRQVEWCGVISVWDTSMEGRWRDSVCPVFGTCLWKAGGVMPCVQCLGHIYGLFACCLFVWDRYYFITHADLELVVSLLSLPQNAGFISIYHYTHHFISSLTRWLTKSAATGHFGSRWAGKGRRLTVERKTSSVPFEQSFPSGSQHLNSAGVCKFLSFASQLYLWKDLYFCCYRLKKFHGTLDNKNSCCQETPNCWIYS